MKLIQVILTGLLLLLTIGCKKDEDPKPDANYTGILKLEYARTFPEFTATATMEVEIDKSGQIYISDPEEVTYSGEDEMELEGSLIKLNETGTITISSISGRYIEIDGHGYLSVNASTSIHGTQQFWGWDDELGWIAVPSTLFSVEDPVASPMNFSIEDAAIAGEGAQLGATVPEPPFGFMTYTWTLGLVAVL